MQTPDKRLVTEKKLGDTIAGLPAATPPDLSSYAKNSAVLNKQDRHREHLGFRTIGVGDSIMRGADGVTNGHTGSWLRYLAAQSYGAIRLFRNAGVAGSTSSAMLARYATEVLAYKPELIVIEGITPNDKAGSDTALVSKSKANIIAMVEQGLASGARVVVCTGPPNGDATINSRMQEMSTWLRGYAATLGLDVWDLYTPVVDQATGKIAAAYDVGDGIHPNAEGREAIAQAIWARVSNDLLPGGILGSFSDTDTVLGDRGLFVSATPANTLADGLVASGAVGSRTERTDGNGYIQTLTGTTALQYADFDITRPVGAALVPETLLWRAGDKFSFAGEVENIDSSGVNIQVNVLVGTTTNQLRAVSNWGLVGKGPRSFYIEDTISADYVGNKVSVRIVPGIGTIKVSRLRVVNISAQERARSLSVAVQTALAAKADASAVYTKAETDAKVVTAPSPFRVWNATSKSWPSLGTPTEPVIFVSTNDPAALAPAEQRLNYDMWIVHPDSTVVPA